MGCTFNTQQNKHHNHEDHKNRHGRTCTIDTRRHSSKVVDKIIQNIILSKQQITKQQISFAVTCFNKLALFNALTNQQIKIIAGLLVQGSTKQGDYVFHQGDSGNCFFLIEYGQVQVQIDGNVIKTLTRGQTFGQLSLILRTKRSAGIKAIQNSKFLIMKPLLFKSTMQKIKTNQYEMKRSAIQHVQIFQGLNNKQRLNLANALKIMVYEKGQRIVSMNELANAFYIINQGKVVIELPNHSNLYLGKYQCFGQSAFKHRGRRTCSVNAVQRTICSIVSRQDFQKHSGIKPESIYYYNMKKWALKKSQVFNTLSKYLQNSINLAFDIIQANEGTKIKNQGLVICLQGKINGENVGEKVFGDKQWKQKSQKYPILIQQQDGYYAFMSIQKLNQIIKSLKQQRKSRQSKVLMASLKNINKENFGVMNLAQFQYLKDLGQGQFGTVKLVRDPKLGQLYALKKITKSSIKKQGLQKYIEQQRKILSKAQFPYIVGFVKAFSDTQNVYFLMQYIKGVELFNVIRQMPSLNKTIARYFFACIMSAIQHLHECGIIYRDVKPQNSVVDSKGKVYLIDMGTAKFLNKQKSYKTFTIIGTPHYMAPQVFLNQGYSFQSDIWSLGVLLYEFLCNSLPFGQNQYDTYKLMQSIKKLNVKYPKNLQPDAEQLLKLMLNKNPKQRAVKATFENIKNNNFFKGFDWEDLLLQQIFPPYIPRVFKQKNIHKSVEPLGIPLIKNLYPNLYEKNNGTFLFKQWNENIAF